MEKSEMPSRYVAACVGVVEAAKGRKRWMESAILEGLAAVMAARASFSLSPLFLYRYRCYEYEIDKGRDIASQAIVAFFFSCRLGS